MRTLRLVVCLLLLTASGLWAQSSSSSSSSSTATANQPQDPNQPQVRPVQELEKAKETDAKQAKPASFDTGAASNSGQNQELGEVRLMTRYSEVNGDDISRSFHVPNQCPMDSSGARPVNCKVGGYNNLGEFNYFSDRRFFVNHRVQMMSMYRGTDDHSIDPERNSLQKAYVRFYGPRDEWIFGDTLASFSRLSFNQNIKGVSVTNKIGDNWKLSGVSGIFIDRYGSIYKDVDKLPGKPYMSVVGGLRLERTVMHDSSVGFNFSTSSDQIDTLPIKNAGDSPFPATNQLLSLDQKFQFKNGLRIESEFAYSFTDFDRRQSICITNCDSRSPETGLGVQGDWGGRIEGSWRHDKLSLRGAYLRYQPNFASMNARQISDLQDMVGRASYDLTSWMTVDGTVRRSNDGNLKQQKPYGIVLWAPEAKFIFHDLAFYRRGTFEVGYRHRLVQSSDNNASVNRFVRIPYAEFTMPLKTTFLSVGYERRQAQDMIALEQTSNTDRVYVTLRGIYDLGGWHINPSLRYELERQGQRPGINPACPAPCVGGPLVDLTLVRNSNRLGSASLFIETPKWFILETAFRSSSATLSNLSSFATLAPGGYSRPSYKAAITYKFRNDENIQFIFAFERNNNFYLPKAASTDYDERLWSGTIVYRFGKRAQGQ